MKDEKKEPEKELEDEKLENIEGGNKIGFPYKPTTDGKEDPAPARDRDDLDTR